VPTDEKSVRVGAALALLLVAAPAAASPPINFVDRAREAGLAGLRGNVGAWYGAAVAFIDLDGDHYPDLFFGAGMGEYDQLCLNQRNGTFTCAPIPGDLPNAGDTLAVTGGDYDGNGTIDLYVMRNTAPVGMPPSLNQLLSNDGHAHFTDVTAQANIGGAAYLISPDGTFLDYDRDGRLDLHVGHWLASDLSPYAQDQLYRNMGDGTFAPAAKSPDNQQRSGLAMLAFDYDGDGWVDLYRGGDFANPILFRNQGNGTFADATASEPLAFQNDATEAMGADIADFDGDGDLDLYVTNSKRPMGPYGAAFFVNQGGGLYTSSAAQYGVTADFSWGVAFLDFDDDTWPDLFVTSSTAGNQFIYRNRGGTGFDEIDYPSPVAGTEDCITLAVADYDNDGLLDVVIWSPHGQAPELLHNESSPHGHYVAIDLVGKAPFTDPLGALVKVTAGARMMPRQLLSQTSHGAQNDRRMVFGLGDATSIDLEVDWPSGAVDNAHLDEVDREVTMIEGKGIEMVMPPPPPPPPPHGCALGGRAQASPFAPLAALLAALAARRRRRR
jgi:hypothetical protein